MNLVLIKGGQFEAVSEMPPAVFGPQHVSQEATRRLRQAGYQQAHMRSLATGQALPKPLHYFKMQVDFVARTLSALDPVPADFASDRYWPTL